jgi:hypothetical protein
MKDGRKARNLWFALAYGLATLVVEVHHDHGAHRDGAEAVHLAGCADPSPHYAGHGAPELIRTDLHCPACQFRAENQAVAARPVPLALAARRLAPLPDSPSLRTAATSRPTSRGPPLS